MGWLFFEDTTRKDLIKATSENPCQLMIVTNSGCPWISKVENFATIASYIRSRNLNSLIVTNPGAALGFGNCLFISGLIGCRWFGADTCLRNPNAGL